MLHEMRLNKEPFEKIKSGKKDIELRLYDEKRKKIKVGDEISFTNKENNEKLCTKVVALYLFDSFEKLYKTLDKEQMGYDKLEIADPKDMEKYYTKEEQQKLGVIGIQIKVI